MNLTRCVASIGVGGRVGVKIISLISRTLTYNKTVQRTNQNFRESIFLNLSFIFEFFPSQKLLIGL